MANTATILTFGLQAGTDRTVYATWSWDRSNTKGYTVRWWYYTADGTMLLGSESSESQRSCAYTAPANATQVVFFVKPESATYKVNNTDVAYWTAEWSTAQRYYFENNPAPVPNVPNVSIDKYTLTAYINNLDDLTTGVEFQIRYTWDDMLLAADTSSIVTGTTWQNQSTVNYTVAAGRTYRVRARAINKHGVRSDWSDFSAPINSMATPPKEITELKALSETSVHIAWSKVSIATGYTIEYTTDVTYFDSNSSEVKSESVDSSVTHAEITGLESGDEYFFRVRATNAGGDSEWTEIKSVIIGKDPAAPTTWSSTTTAVTGETVIFYWIHNSEDSSSQTYAELELTIGGMIEVFTIKNSEDEDEKDRTSSYEFDTTGLTYGTQILWRVRTAGVTGEYGDWSIQRCVDVHAPAVLTLSVTDKDTNSIEVLRSYPFYVYGVTGPFTQAPVGYSLSIVSKESYETVDDLGNVKMVNADEPVYTKYFDTDDALLVEFSAGNIKLENNVIYLARCTVAMNSGLTATDSVAFRVAWDDDAYSPNAEIGVDKNNVAVYIRPYCEYTPEGSNTPELVEGVTLSVYRREFDGSFTELATGLKNTSRTFVTDPHPALDYARYRIVATTESTGAVSYYDMPSYPIGEKAIIIQWNEGWSNFNSESEDQLAQPAWTGSLLRLPYNIDVSEAYDTDVSMIKYIGRKRPVTYYGTQLGSSATWNVDVEVDDEETIYGLRRLAIYTGDVYVREPSGTGYWANVTVSFSKKHLELTIPVTLTVTRVEGGV